MKKVFNKKNKFLTGILLMSLGTVVGFQNCSREPSYNTEHPSKASPASTDVSQVFKPHQSISAN